MAKFDGIDDVLIVTHSDSLNLGKGDYSISIFIQAEANIDDLKRVVIHKGNDDEYQPLLYIQSNL